jgi:predicted secreted protein
MAKKQPPQEKPKDYQIVSFSCPKYLLHVMRDHAPKRGVSKFISDAIRAKLALP